VGYVGNANDLVLTNIELRRMFDFLDVNGVGYIDRDDLIAVVRPVLSDGRKALVRAAIRAVFDPYVDAPGDESLPAKRLLQRVRIERHPDVTAGRVPVHEAYEAFLDTFDVGSEIPYRVSRQEFLDYYTNLSAAVEDDRYFEALIRGVWGLEGGVLGAPQEGLSTSLPAAGPARRGRVHHSTLVFGDDGVLPERNARVGTQICVLCLRLYLYPFLILFSLRGRLLSNLTLRSLNLISWERQSLRKRYYFSILWFRTTSDYL